MPEILGRQRPLGVVSVPFTPALSLREREDLRQLIANAAFRNLGDEVRGPLFPEEEGRGEGEGRHRPALPSEDDLCTPRRRCKSGGAFLPGRCGQESSAVLVEFRCAKRRGGRRRTACGGGADRICWTSFAPGPEAAD